MTRSHRRGRPVTPALVRSARTVLGFLCAAAAIALLSTLGHHELGSALATPWPWLMIGGGISQGIPANLDVAVSSRAAIADWTAALAANLAARVDVATSTRSTNADMQTVLARLPNVGFTSTQYGSVTIAAATGAGTATITSVDTTKSCVIPLGWTTATGTAPSMDLEEGWSFDITLTNATTVTVTRRATLSGDITVNFSVVYFATANSVQIGTVTLTNVASATATITSVNVTKALCLFLGTMQWTNVNEARDRGRVTLTNATTVTATKGDLNGITQYRFVVVEMQ